MLIIRFYRHEIKAAFNKFLTATQLTDFFKKQIKINCPSVVLNFSRHRRASTEQKTSDNKTTPRCCLFPHISYSYQPLTFLENWLETNQGSIIEQHASVHLKHFQTIWRDKEMTLERSIVEKVQLQRTFFLLSLSWKLLRQEKESSITDVFESF